MKVFRVSERITSRETGTFKQYLNDIASIDMLNAAEEELYSIRASNGDKEAMDILVRANLRFVVSVAKQYETATLSLEDLVNEGNIGLIMAAEKYKIDTGFKFITYAVYWIRKMILEYLSKHGKLVRLPANKIASINKLNKRSDLMEQQLGREVDIAEIMSEYDAEMSDEDVNDLQRIATLSFESLDSPFDDSEVGSRYDILADDSNEPTDHLLLNEDLKGQIGRAMKHLSERDRKIVTLLFGLDGSAPLTLKEVSEEVDLTREMVRQIKEKSLKRLSRYLKNA